MHGKIALLADHVINQIAAGEVIENPASVVKELVDNALDAGASSISIDLEAGGHQLIRVEDDGCGMNRQDVELCLLRHATSKLRDVADFDRLATLGFRGEALAAIASVCKLEILTSEGEQGIRLLADGGRILEILPASRRRGTSIAAESLFFNAPARRKFQKSPAHSRAQIFRLAQALALGHPHAAFRLASQGKELLCLDVSSWDRRAREVLENTNGEWFELDGLRGFLGAAADAKETRRFQQIFLNRRPISSPLLARAVEDAYGTRIARGSHPPFLLFLELSPEEFDVNVHPQKREVRFRQEQELFLRVKRSLEKVLAPSAAPAFSGPVDFTPPPIYPWSLAEEAPPSPRQEPLFAEAKGRGLAVVGSFLLAMREGKLLLVELAHAYEQRLVSNATSQALLWPLEATLSAEEAVRSEDLLGRLHALGVEARAVGKRSLAIDALPEWLSAKDFPPFWEQIKDDVLQGFGLDATRKRHARRAASSLTLAEAEWLWNHSVNAREILLEHADLERIANGKKP